MNEFLRVLLALPPQASSVARDVDLLHFWVIGSTMAGAAGVAAFAGYFFIRYRVGAHPSPPDARRPSSRSRRAEWSVVAGLFALFIVFWVFGFRQYVAMRTPPPGALEVYVTGKQWMWKFAYPEGNEGVDELTVPAFTPVKLVMTSRDVIHSFYVPAFRLKYDVVPGRYTTAWFEATVPGVYPIYCAEFCGVSHSLMKGRVVVLSREDYAAWLDGAAPRDVAVSLAEQGRRVAARNQCFACHTIDGRNHVGPSFRGLYGSTVPLAGGEMVTADEAYLTRSMMRPLEEVVAGYKPVMPTYAGVLSAPDVAALVEYIRALRGTPSADTVGAPLAQDPRADLVGGGIDQAGSGINTGLIGAEPTASVPATASASPLGPVPPPPASSANVPGAVAPFDEASAAGARPPVAPAPAASFDPLFEPPPFDMRDRGRGAGAPAAAPPAGRSTSIPRRQQPAVEVRP